MVLQCKTITFKYFLNRTITALKKNDIHDKIIIGSGFEIYFKI